MKKVYDAPTAEKISFNYQDQVVASGGSSQCGGMHKEYYNSDANDGCDFYNEGIINAR